MALRTEPVEGSSHVKLFFSCHVEKSQIHGRAPRMTAFLHYILLIKEHALVKIGIKVWLHPDILQVGGPTDKMIDGLLWTVGIVYLETVSLLNDIITHGTKCLCSLFRKQGRGLLIPVDAVSHKVVCTIIADLHYGIRNGIGKHYERTRVLRHRHVSAIFPAAGK